MLQDELKQLSGGCSAAAFSAVKAAWRAAVFSEASDHALKRYFNYHLSGITGLLGQTAADQDGLLDLLDHLLMHHRDMLDPAAITPSAYRDRELRILQLQLNELTPALTRLKVEQDLKKMLAELFTRWAEESIAAHLSFRGLHYFRTVLTKIHELAAAPAADEAQLHRLLEELNFNHLGYFCYRRQQLLAYGGQLSDQHRLCYYHEQLRTWRLRPTTEHAVYHPDWPSLRTMLSDMLSEEIREIKGMQATPARPAKIRLDLSVAQAACLLHLLAAGGVFGDQPLQAVFRSFSENFSTRRQADISSHSLSKAYYSIDQVTAAVMRDKLRSMLTRIDRDFFPG